MLNLTEIKVGKKILFDGQPFLVMFSQHSKMNRAGAVLRTKLKNLLTGAIIQKTFQGADKVEEAEVDDKQVQYLYRDNGGFVFMDLESYDQLSLSEKVIGNRAGYLKEGTEVKLLFFKSQPIDLELPVKMDFRVTEAPPAVRGNTVDGGSKQVTIETGIKVNTPLFIKEGDTIRVNTDTGEYVERV